MMRQIYFDIAISVFKITDGPITLIDKLHHVGMPYFLLVSFVAAIFLAAAGLWIEFLSPAMFFALLIFSFTCTSYDVHPDHRRLLEVLLIAIPATLLNVFLIIREYRSATSPRDDDDKPPGIA